MRYKSAFLLLVFLFFTSCNLTQKLWSNYYEEKLGIFMVSQDGQYVAFLGEKYHYIFNENGGIMKQLLFSPYRFLMSISSSKTYVKLSKSNELEATVTIEINTATIDPVAEQHLNNLGFFYDSDKKLIARIKLYGKRYLANGDLSNVSFHLNRQYSIKIYESISSTEKVEKIALTPITVTIDAVVLIGKILLMPFMGN